MRNQLLRDDEEFRRSLLGDDQGYVPEGFVVPAAPEVPEFGQQPAPAGDDHLLADLPAPDLDESHLTSPARLTDVQDAAAAPAAPDAPRPDLSDLSPGPQPQQPAESGVSSHRMNKILQAIGAAGTASKLPDSFYQDPQGPAADPTLDLKRALYEAKIAKLQQQPAARSGASLDPFKDPSSPQSRAFQQFLLTNRPDIVERNGGPEGVRALSHTQIKDAVAMADRETGLTDAIRGRRESEMDRDLSRALAEQGQQLVQTRFGVNELHKLGDVSAPFAEITETMKRIDELAPGLLHGDLPKDFKLTDTQRLMTDFPWGLGKRFAEKDSVALKSALDNFADLLIRSRTGAVINDQEFANYRNLMATALAAGPQAMAAVLTLFRRGIRAKLAAKQATYKLSNPAAFEEWARETGNVTYTDPLMNERTAAGAPAQPEPDLEQGGGLTPDMFRQIGSGALDKLNKALGAPSLPTSTPVREPQSAGLTPDQGAELAERAAAQPSQQSAELAAKVTAARKQLQPGEVLMHNQQTGKLKAVPESAAASAPAGWVRVQ